jgi:two-component system, OmpR family, sensor histidine kinase ChvG
VSLRLKLLLLSLTTLVLPWAGCQYAREMESALRLAEGQSLSAVAQTIAASLQGREDLLYRMERDPGSVTELDLVPIELPGDPAVDGYPDDWPTSRAAWKTFNQPQDRLRVLTGLHDRMLYLLLDVRDERLIFDSQGAGPRDFAVFGDRLWLGFETPQGTERQVLIAATGGGPTQVRHIETGDLGEERYVVEPRIAAAWQSNSGGYRVELRIPLSMLGHRLGVLVDDRDIRGAKPVSYGTLRPDDLQTRGRLIAASSELAAYLTQFLQTGLHLTVTAPSGSLLTEVTAPPALGAAPPSRGLLEQLYRRFLDRPGERRLTGASASIRDRPNGRVIGRLQITQDTDRWLTLRDRALTMLFNFTLVTSLVAVLGMFAFAARLAWRLARLRRASESALTRTGLVTTFPEMRSADELGDVARSFATLLRRLDEYTGYLRTLAGKLAHEIRTPLTIVRSSLENLENESATNATARSYIARAREGSERLGAILQAMNAATRVEEAIHNAERVRFELVPVIVSAVEAYRIAFPQRKFTIEVPEEPIAMDGAPDLIVQLLDKLIDNAVDFSPADSTIVVRLTRASAEAHLDVENAGSTLAPENRSRIFESLWQSRTDGDERPHFGLGLYIVKLIAEFHDGHASAENLSDGSGVRFTIRLPLQSRE